jgi:hypothetical protein
MISVDVPVTSVMLSGDDRSGNEDKFIMTSGGEPVSTLVSNSFSVGLLRGDLPMCLDEPFFFIQLALFLGRL